MPLTWCFTPTSHLSHPYSPFRTRTRTRNPLTTDPAVVVQRTRRVSHGQTNTDCPMPRPPSVHPGTCPPANETPYVTVGGPAGTYLDMTRRHQIIATSPRHAVTACVYLVPLADRHVTWHFPSSKPDRLAATAEFAAPTGSRCVCASHATSRLLWMQRQQSQVCRSRTTLRSLLLAGSICQIPSTSRSQSHQIRTSWTLGYQIGERGASRRELDPLGRLCPGQKKALRAIAWRLYHGGASQDEASRASVWSCGEEYLLSGSSMLTLPDSSTGCHYVASAWRFCDVSVAPVVALGSR